MERWLSLEVSESQGLEKGSGPSFLIVIPKKVIRLATERNRIRRLIKESVRHDKFFQEEKVYKFKVKTRLASWSLAEVKEAIDASHE